jgi:hypothetical protein
MQLPENSVLRHPWRGTFDATTTGYYFLSLPGVPAWLLAHRRRIVMSARKSAILTTIFFAAAATQWAPEFAARPRSADQRQVYLVRLDQSDCTYSNVPNQDAPDVDGLVTVIRGNDGNTTVKIAMTASSNTSYHFYLKCVRQLGDIRTGDDGVGTADFTFPTNSTAATYAFDMYPEGAPPGNKFQNATVSF